VEWAELPDMARPQTANYELVVKTKEMDSRAQVELCAPCHSRRAILGDYTHAEPNLLDSMLPSLLTPELYFADGQILEEVYVYGSFTQSKMYRRNVRCSDCHDVHSIKKVKEGNALCLQCHRANIYDTKAHHFHKSKGDKGEPIKSADGKVLFDVGTGAECVQCHMPERPYMVIDYRADHSFRLPRPDLSIKLGTPNACNRCHIDKTNQWSNEYITKWYGPGRRAHYGTIIAEGRKGSPIAHKDLIKLASDPLYPVIVRSTALSLLSAYPAKETTRTYELALMDDEALIRRTAVDYINVSDPRRQTALLTSMLYDPVKTVRIEAARRMTEISDPPWNIRLTSPLAVTIWEIFMLPSNSPKRLLKTTEPLLKSIICFIRPKSTWPCCIIKWGKIARRKFCFVRWPLPSLKCTRCNILLDCCWRKKKSMPKQRII
jgi:hypothetical protein